MTVEVSIGEFLDKLTILSIKLKYFKDPDKLANVRREYDYMQHELRMSGISIDPDDLERLSSVNEELWHIEDGIRLKEQKKEFDDQFVALARSVYITNDKRAAIKREVNIKYKSGFIEEKEYAGAVSR